MSEEYIGNRAKNLKTLKKSEITQVMLGDLFEYNVDSGVFLRRIRTGQNVQSGAVAGSMDGKGYWQISVCGRVFRAHRLVWLYVYGRWPDAQIDHINGDKADNRLTNLREVTNAQNMQNRLVLQKNNTSGFAGVSFYKPTGKWKSQIKVNGGVIFLGYFDTPEKAHEVYLNAKSDFHPSWAGGLK